MVWCHITRETFQSILPGVVQGGVMFIMDVQVTQTYFLESRGFKGLGAMKGLK